MLRQRAECTAQPGGSSHTTLPSPSHGMCVPLLVSSCVARVSSISCYYLPTFLQHFLVDPFLFVLFFSVCTKSATEQPSPDLHSNPRPRPSAGGAAAVTCRRVARTSVRSATHGAKAGRREGGRRRPRRSQSSGAGHRAATTTPTKRNRATATSVTTSNRFIAADHDHAQK